MHFLRIKSGSKHAWRIILHNIMYITRLAFHTQYKLRTNNIPTYLHQSNDIILRHLPCRIAYYNHLLTYIIIIFSHIVY